MSLKKIILRCPISLVFGVSLSAFAAPMNMQKQLIPELHAPIHEVGELRSAPSLEMESEPRNRLVNFDVVQYDLDVVIDPTQKKVSGSNTISFRTRSSNVKSITLDAVDMQIIAVKGQHGVDLGYFYDGEVLTITFPETLDAAASHRVTIHYAAPMAQSLYIASADATKPQRMSSAYTYTEPEGSSLWYPCLDRPEDKALMTIKVTVPEGFKVLSNGQATAFDVREGGSAVFSYRMDEPIATYLVSVVIGNYDISSIGTYENKPLTIWAPAELLERMAYDTEHTADMMASFAKFTGLKYPFASYSQSVAEAWRSSMEHQSATTMGGGRITGDRTGESVVAHELAHQWFGDWVTCRNWGELWLNEGFASYLPFVYFGDAGENVRELAQLNYFRSGYFEQAKTDVHPLSQASLDIETIFDSHSYEKGALVIHLLRNLANQMPAINVENSENIRETEETFTAALRYYLYKNGTGTVTSQNLQEAMEHVTGESWQLIFDQWVRSEGHPVLNTSYLFEESPAFTAATSGFLKVTVEQTQHLRAERTWRLFSFPLDIEVILADGSSSLFTVQVYDDTQTFTLPLQAAPLAVNLDPLWRVPAEITLTQDGAAWRDVLRYSPRETSRVIATRKLAQTIDGAVNADVVEMILADQSLFLLGDALDVLSEHPANHDHILAILQKLQTSASDQDLDTSLARKRQRLDSYTRGAMAVAENWLIQNLPTVPTRDQEQLWQQRFMSSDLVTERAALLEMLKKASLENAQIFAATRLSESTWVTADRIALINVLTVRPTAASTAFIESVLTSPGTELYQTSILNNLTAAHYDNPEVVAALIVGANSHQGLLIRALYTTLLGEQRNSKNDVCPHLESLASAGLNSVRPESYAAIRAAAKSSQVTLGCREH